MKDSHNQPQTRTSTIRGRYNSGPQPAQYEPKWQKKWEEESIYSPDINQARSPYYNLMMFPYPSAEGLHVGNMYAFTGADVHGRFMRMRGFYVFEPIGLDGFGIHSENYALKVNQHPKKQAKISAKHYYQQLRATGNAYDWQRTLETYDPDYYRWTQWLFISMFKHGLAYRKKAEVNWCPGCKTVLADEQVIARSQSAVSNTQKEVGIGVCERCDTEIILKNLEQWFFKITNYAERLLQNTYKSSFNWPNKVKLGQRNWIGKKVGININYQIPNTKFQISCFTTRPDTNFGATFVVLAPEHPLCLKITTQNNAQTVKQYINEAQKKSREERIDEGRKKTGVFTGRYAINQLNDYKMPIWISDFVLMEFGTGAVVGVPGHDKRDFEFAQQFDLPVIRVVVAKDGDKSPITKIEQVQEDEGMMVNSDFLNGLDIHAATTKMMDHIEEKGWGKRMTTYRLRDWLISRQRYWGAPIPMVFCQSCADQGKSWFTTKEAQANKENPKSQILNPKQTSNTNVSNLRQLEIRNSKLDIPARMAGWFPVPEDQLPVELPDIKDWKPTGTGRGPLAGVPEFYRTKCPHCGGEAERETDVCDTFLDSSWYYLRYPNIETKNSKLKAQNHSVKLKTSKKSLEIRNSKLEIPWNHEITRCWLPVDSYIGGAEHTVLHLLYTRFVWRALRDMGYLKISDPKDDSYDPDEPFKRFYAHGLIIKDGAKMSKSKGNVVVPDKYIKKYGADTLRTYLMFLGPFDQGGDFSDAGIVGVYKWLNRVWRLNQVVISNQKSVIRQKDLDPSTAVQRIGSQHASHDKAQDRQDDTPDLKSLSGVSSKAKREMAKTIKGVTEDLEKLRYNTAIAKLMEFTNWWKKHPEQITVDIVRDFLLLLAPFAPFMTEELYQALQAQKLKFKSQNFNSKVKTNTKYSFDSAQDKQIPDTRYDSIHLQSWPKYDLELVKEDQVTVVVQINGKLRDNIVMEVKDAHLQSVVEQKARTSAKVQKWLQDKKIKQTVFVPGKLVNFVI